MMRLPSGDQSGQTSTAGSNVNLVIVPRATSNSQMSCDWVSSRPTTILLPSGDSQGSW